MSTYIGSKVAVLEAAEHEYVHVYDVDGDNIVIDENGFLGIKEGFTLGDFENGTFERKPVYFHPAGWNFVDNNKNPDVEAAVYLGTDDRLPTIYPNCSGTKNQL